MSTGVHIEHTEGVKYPEWQEESCYGPAKMYPEFAEYTDIVLSENNQVYEMIRNTFIALDLDTANFGTREWNPLSDIIKSGDVVLLKPNMVYHKNKKEGESMDCLDRKSVV